VAFYLRMVRQHLSLFAKGGDGAKSAFCGYSEFPLSFAALRLCVRFSLLGGSPHPVRLETKPSREISLRMNLGA
jgi:hypothetical protein